MVFSFFSKTEDQGREKGSAMDRLYLLSWYYQGLDGEPLARDFYSALQSGARSGIKFPFNCPTRVGLVHCGVDEHWAVGVLVMRGTPGDDSVEQTDRILQWCTDCGAEYAGTDRTGMRATSLSIEEILQSKYGMHYTCEEEFDPHALAEQSAQEKASGEPLGQAEPTNAPETEPVQAPEPPPPAPQPPLSAWDRLAPEQRAMAADLMNFGSRDPDMRYHAYRVLDQKRYDDGVLLDALPEIAAALPEEDPNTRAQLYLGLGYWLGMNRYTRPKGMELIQQAAVFAPKMALPHAILGALLMGDSSNAFLEKNDRSIGQYPELSGQELGLLAQHAQDQATKELERAISLEPDDPTPYYAFCKSKLLGYAEMKGRYQKGMLLDKTHSPEFGASHYDFAMMAARAGFTKDAVEAFLRAMIAAPQEYGSGPGTMRPQSGPAFECWQTAKGKFASYQDAQKRTELWGAAPVVTPQPPKPPEPAGQRSASPQPQRPPAPAGQPDEKPRKPSSAARWVWGCLGILLGMVCIGSGLLLLKPPALNFAALPGLTSTPTATAVPPTATPLPPTATATFPPGPRTGHYEGMRPSVSFDITGDGNIANFALNAPFGASTCNIKIEKIEVTDSKFVLDVTTADKEQATIGIFTIKGQIEGTVVTGTHNISFCGRTVAFNAVDQPWKAEWKSSTVSPTKAVATPAVQKPAPTKTPATAAANPDRPVIIWVTLRKDYSSNGSLEIYQDILFTDRNGDAIRIDYRIDSSTNPDVQVEGGTFDISSAEQKAGAKIIGQWSCGGGTYTVNLSAIVTDRAGNKSEPYPYTLECK
jgi:tetratricopeptide (TPR) repeat protein